MTHHVGLGEFLRARRKAVSPEAVSLPVTRSRRVPGLRRQEVAQLAGVSVDYYSRLEQGRQSAASESVLTALATALGLTDVERQHLFDLAGCPVKEDQADAAQSARLGLLRLMETLGATPAVVRGRRTDLLAMNDAARTVIADLHTKPACERNIARWIFLDPEARRFANWEEVAKDFAGTLRMEMGRHPSDTRLQSLVDELDARSDEFSGFWAECRVTAGLPVRKVINHPAAGTLEFHMESVSSWVDHDQVLDVFMPADSFTEQAVAGLVTAWKRERRRLADHAGRRHRP